MKTDRIEGNMMFCLNSTAERRVLRDMFTQGRVLALVSILVAVGDWGVAQPPGDGPGRLPPPTGAFGVGRVTLLFEDSSRIEPLDPNASARRIMVDVWYPAEKSAIKAIAAAEYLNVAAFERALAADGLRKQLGGSYDVIKAGGAVTHAAVQAPFSSSLPRAAVLIFSPGGGMIKELYTSQLEDLASHGFIVAAITHSYDGFLTLFPDGNYIAHNSKRWPPIPSIEGEANLNQLEWHTDDILVVLNQLGRFNDRSSSRLPFSGRMDLTRVGAFGHSFGGVAAAHACQKDWRIKACLNQDGAMAMKPFYLDARGWGMNQAFMLIERPPNREPLTDADLAAMKLTRPRAMELIQRLNVSRDRVLRSTGTGSYRVLLQRSVTMHMDFSDLQLLGARNTADLEQRIHVLTVVRSYTLAFFDKYVRGMKAPLLDRSAPDQLIESVERFGPAKRPN
jgi:predicted dienelactone hydrolase